MSILTIEQRDDLCEIRRLIETAVLNSDTGAVDNEALDVLVRLIDRRWQEFVKERGAPPEAPARH
jgi:hypothetical protein